MKRGWQSIKLGELLAKSDDWIELDPLETYKEVTVRLWGQGVTLRGEASGAEIRAPRRLRVRAGQFILSRIDARNGAFGVIPDELDGAVVSSDFPAFDVHESRLLPGYLGWLSRTRDFVEACRAASEGTTNRVRLKEERFLAIEIPLPPLDEQRRMVAVIELLAGKIGEARGLREGAVREAETLTTVSAREILGTISVGITPLRSWLAPGREGIQTGPFGAQLGRGDFTDRGVPVLTIGNVQYGGLRTDGLKYVSSEKAQRLDRYSIQEGDILFARMGTVGRCCVVPQQAEGWLINYHIIRVALDQTRVDPRHIHWTIQAAEDVETYLAETTRGATRAGVNSKIVGSIPCRVPPLPEQRRIVAYLDGLQAKVDQLKALQAQTAAELEALLPAVLEKAFRGEL